MTGTRRSTMNKRRKGKLAVILPWFKRFGVVLGICVVTLWLGAWLWLGGSVHKAADWSWQKTLNVTADMGFTVNNILVEGRIHTDADILEALVNVRKDDPLFAFNPEEARHLIERISWVRQAHVERRFPDTIYIRLEERRPLALWQQNKKLSLLDEEGQVITSEGLARFKELVVVTGEGAPSRVPALIMNLSAESALSERVKAAQWVGNRRWDLTLDGKIILKLPESDVGLALRRLALAQEEDGLLDKDIVSVDVREPDRIVVRTRPGAVQEYKAGLKTGDNI